MKTHNKLYLILLILIIVFFIYILYLNKKIIEKFSNDNNLVYYTHGYNNKFLDLLELSIQSLRIKNNNDILVICDESYVNDCKIKLNNYNNIFIYSVKDSNSPAEASMNKLKVFEYKDIDKYNKILFIDSDIIIDIELNSIFDNLVDDNILYVKRESNNHEHHTNIYWSLTQYTQEQLDYFKENNIFIFNCGEFAFINSINMKTHFNNINNLILNHNGESFYEQSFMNHYFNLNQLKDDNILEDKVRLFPEKNTEYKDKLIHFCGAGNSPENKYNDMLNYYISYIKIS